MFFSNSFDDRSHRSQKNNVTIVFIIGATCKDCVAGLVIGWSFKSFLLTFELHWVELIEYLLLISSILIINIAFFSVYYIDFSNGSMMN